MDSRGGPGTAEGAPRPMMKRFKFKVYNPVAITTTHRQVLGSGGASGAGAGQQQHHHHHAEGEVIRACVVWCGVDSALDDETDTTPQHRHHTTTHPSPIRRC